MTKRRLGGLAAVAVCIAALGISPVAAQSGDDEEFVADRIHSNLPLYTFDWEDLWPRGFTDQDGFGCTSRVGFGDWRFVPTEGNEDDQEFWDRYSNYGVFHCAAIMGSAEQRAELGEADWEYGFFVRLGEARRGSVKWELWALQQGITPGSDYILLAREAGQEGLIEKFYLLQQQCPAGRMLQAEGFDIWSTSYCAINSRNELLALARRMLRLRARGTLERVPTPEINEAPEEDSGASSE